MENFKTYFSTLLIVLIVIGVVAVAARYTRDMNAARERIESSGQPGGRDTLWGN